jgi:hypothetical protein
MAGINQINELTQSPGKEANGAPKAEKTNAFSNILTKTLNG